MKILKDVLTPELNLGITFYLFCIVIEISTRVPQKLKILNIERVFVFRVHHKFI